MMENLEKALGQMNTRTLFDTLNTLETDPDRKDFS
jgi:hypothetical protein